MIKQKSYTPENYYEVMRLKNQGISNKMISRVTSISESTIKSWLYKKQFPKHFSKKYRNSILKNLVKAKLRLYEIKRKKFLELSKKITPDFTYVLGAVLGDGYIYFHPNGGGHVRISVRDKDFAYKFYKSLKRWSDLDCRIYNFEGFWRIYSSSIAVAKVLKEFELNKLKQLSRNLIASFLRGLYDAEGNINQKHIRFYNSNLNLINLVKELLGFIGINYIQISKRRKEIHNIKERIVLVKPVYTLTFGRRANLELFYKKIGFSIKRKQMKLRNTLESYQRIQIPWSNEELIAIRNAIKTSNLNKFGSRAILCRRLSERLNRSESSVWKRIEF